MPSSIYKPCLLADPHYGRRKKVVCPKCSAKPHQNCKRFDDPNLKSGPIVCPRECPPY